MSDSILSPLLVDSHCHLDRLDLRSYEGDLSRALEAADDAGVGHFLCVAIDLQRWPAMLELACQSPRVSVSVGVHPSAETDQPTVEALVRLAAHPRVVAIGETGLDYYYGKDRIAEQQERFRIQIRAARETAKPLIIHARDAKEDILRILEEENAAEVGGVMHCFTGDWDMAERSMALNFYVSFSGIVSFRSAQELREVARQMPIERLLVETDSPYLAPVPYRGKPNQPAWVRQVAACVAELRGESLESLAASTTSNYFRLFGGDWCYAD